MGDHDIPSVTSSHPGDARPKEVPALELPSKALDDDLRLMTTLLEISQDIFATLDFKEVLNRIVKRIAGVIRVVRCSIVLVEEKKTMGRILATCEDPDLEGIRIDLNKYPEITTAVQDEKFVLIQDVTQDPMVAGVRDALVKLGIRSILVIPILDMENKKGSVIGTLYLRTSTESDALSEAEIRFCQIVAQIASAALNNSRRYQKIENEKQQLETLAVTDELTALYNHRYFFQRLREEFKRASRHQTPLSCIMCDIDDFKLINDLYGHPQGDKVLQETARLIRQCSRETDIAARYGGEEFALILPHTTAEQAMLLAQRIRQAIKNFTFSGLKEGQVVTVSLGIATSPHPSIRRTDDLLKMADQSLYEAKVLGKDRVEVANP